MLPYGTIIITMSGMVAVSAPIWLRPLLLRKRVLDVPSTRSSHSEPTLRGGGISQLSALLAGVLLTFILIGYTAETFLLFIVFSAGVSVGMLGLVEDLHGVAVSVRASIQLLTGAGFSGVLISFSEASWWWLPILTVGFAGYVNAVNFMDGINGISSLHGGVVGGCYAVLGSVLNIPWLTLSGLMIAVIFLAFLPWNLRVSAMFLGDVGSYLLGGLIAATSSAAFLSGVPFVACLAPLVPYLVDTGTTLARRIARGDSWKEPHREHIYQRLTDSGATHLHVAITVAAFSALSGSIALLALLSNPGGAILAWFPLGGVVLLYVMLPKLSDRHVYEGIRAK